MMHYIIGQVFDKGIKFHCCRKTVNLHYDRNCNLEMKSCILKVGSLGICN